MYQLSRPAVSLAEYIEHYWSVSASEAAPLELRVEAFVDARADLVFNFGAPYQRAVIGEPPRTLRSSNLDGQRSQPICIVQRGAVVITGVRFHIAGLSAFLPASVAAFSDRVAPITEAFGPEIVQVEQELREAGADLGAQTRLLDAFFTRRLRPTAASRTVRSLRSRVEAASGLLRVDELCDAAGLSIRQLDRLFRAHLGFTPKTYCRIVRFQRALGLLKTDPRCTLAAVAAQCGYYDQPHFIREFKAYAGVAPRGKVGYFPPGGPTDFSPNVVQFVQDAGRK